MPSSLTSLVGSRICHDLIGPIGAIGNGIELLTLTDGDKTSEMALINESIEHANARIRFFRIAYGSVSKDSAIRKSEILSILAAVAKGGKFTYYWQIEADQLRSEVRAAFLVLQCFETAMPLGGDISVSVDKGIWSLSAKADRLAIDETLWQCLEKGVVSDTISASQVQFGLLPVVLNEAGRSLKVYTTLNSITVQF